MAIANDVDELTGRSSNWDHIQTLQAQKLHPKKSPPPTTNGQILAFKWKQHLDLYKQAKQEALTAHQQNLLPMGSTDTDAIIVQAGTVLGFLLIGIVAGMIVKVIFRLVAERVLLRHNLMTEEDIDERLAQTRRELDRRLDLVNNSLTTGTSVWPFIPARVSNDITISKESKDPVRKMPGDWNNNLLVYARPQDLKKPDPKTIQPQQEYSNPPASGAHYYHDSSSNEYSNIPVSGVVVAQAGGYNAMPQTIEVTGPRMVWEVDLQTHIIMAIRYQVYLGEEIVLYSSPIVRPGQTRLIYQDEIQDVEQRSPDISALRTHEANFPIALSSGSPWYRITLRNGEVYETWR